MSRFVGRGGSAAASDSFLYSEDWVEYLRLPSVSAVVTRSMLCIQYGTQYSDVLWSRSRLLPGDATVLPGTDAIGVYRYWWVDWRARGWGRKAQISGVTRDSNNNVLGSCTVHLFRTSDDLEVDQTVSDPSTGAFVLNTPYDTNHYLVAYLAGSPDVAGTSINTLTGI